MAILFDVTTTAHTRYLTGIQRVVEEFGASLSGDGYVKLGVATDDFGYQYQILKTTDFRDLRKKANIVPSTTTLIKIKAFILGHPILAKAFHLVGVINLYRKIRSRNSLSRIVPNIIDALEIENFDSYLTADAFWNSPRDLARIIEASKRGLKIGIVVHDVLPLTHSLFFRKDSVEIFKTNFSIGISLAHNLFFVSEYTKNEFQKIFPQNISQKYVINLGVRPTEFGVDLFQIPKNLNIGPYAIMVGTIEPRKNYDLVLEVFKNNPGFPKLVIVGREGWLSRGTIKKIKKQSGKVVWLNEVDDELLAMLVQEADFGICASLAEGYGLPLREFVNAGLQTIASDIPPFRAIHTKTEIIFFDPDSSSSLTHAIKSLKLKKGVLESKILTWEQAAYAFSKLL